MADMIGANSYNDIKLLFWCALQRKYNDIWKDSGEHKTDFATKLVPKHSKFINSFINFVEFKYERK